LVFSSLIFLFGFLPVVLLAYTVLDRRLRLPFLLLANLVFYGWGEPVYVLLMLFTTAVNYGFGLGVGRWRQTRPALARLCLGAAAVISLGLLAWFKYAGFLAGLWNAMPFAAKLVVPKVALPIGISFYTFQALSYTIDVWRGDTGVQRNPVTFGVYITLFPQLIAGPIVRYKDVAAQLDGHRARTAQFAWGVRLFTIGLGKKVLIANRMGLLWDALRPGAATGGILPAWVGIIAYTFQIYFDFSGYSDMACGLGNMLGLEFMRNFNYPYISRSVTEFWRRWHISLSTWFRDYVYIPLGGSRRGKGRTILNLLVVWLLTGMWHGASWNFVAWGLYYFIILAMEKAFLLKLLDRVPAVARHLYTLLLVMLGWVLFYFDGGFDQCIRYIGAMFDGRNGMIAPDAVNVVVRYLPILFAAALAATPLPARLWARLGLDTKPAGAVLEPLLCLGLLVLCVAVLASHSYNPFLYFRF